MIKQSEQNGHNYNQLKNIYSILNTLKTEDIYQDDEVMMGQLCADIKSLWLDETSVTIDKLDFIQQIINQLDRKYDNFFDVVNLYDVVYNDYKQMLHKRYIDGLRNENRKNRRENSGD